MSSKLALGTAQFSNNYGITNKLSLQKKDIEQIIETCKKYNIDTIDTAPDYEGVEKKIGLCDLSNFKVITKVSLKNNILPNSIDEMEKKIKGTFNNLKIEEIYAILIRNPFEFLKNSMMLEKVISYKKLGFVKKIGFTVYSPLELKYIYKIWKPDIVQIPRNIIDDRFDEQGWITKLYNDNVEIHVRSIFLQGILLENIKCLPPIFKKYNSFFIKLENWIKESKISKLEACLGHSFFDKRISRIVIGINSTKNFRQIANMKTFNPVDYPKWLNLDDENLINPSCW